MIKEKREKRMFRKKKIVKCCYYDIEVWFPEKYNADKKLRLTLTERGEYIDLVQTTGDSRLKDIMDFDHLIPKPMFNAIRYLLKDKGDVLDFKSINAMMHWKVTKIN